MAFDNVAPPRALLFVQLLLVVSVLLSLLCMPPVRGGIMLVPFGANARAAMLPLAIAHGALLVDRGPLPGSYIVRGDRALLVPTMFSHGILALNAPAAGCGARAKV